MKQTVEEAAKNIPMIAETGSFIVNHTALLTLFLAHNGSQSNRLG